MKLQILFYKSLCTAAALLLSFCHPSVDTDPTPKPNIPEIPDTPDEIEPAYSCSLVLSNDTEYPVAVYMFFDPQSGSMYKFAIPRRTIPACSAIYLAENRLLGKTETLFDDLWTNVRASKYSDLVFFSIFKMNPYTSEDEERLIGWDKTSSPFFQEESWTYTEHAGWYDETHPITFCEWTLSIADNMDNPEKNE